MTSIERVLAAVTGGPADRRAFAPLLSLYGAQLVNCPLDQYYADATAFIKGQVAVRDAFGPDLLFAPFNLASLGAAFGAEARFFQDQPPNLRRPAAGSLAEWHQMAMPDLEQHPYLRFYRHSLRGMVSEFRGESPVAAILPGPFEIPALAVGLEAWLEAVLFDPEATRRALERSVPWFIDFAGRVLADGAALIVLPCGFASPLVLPRKMVARWVAPVLREALGRVRGPVIAHPAGGPFQTHLELLAGLPSVAGFALDSRESVAEARRMVGPKAVLLAGPPGISLAGGVPEEIEAECRELLAAHRHDRRFILYTSGADVPLGTPPENILALRRAIEAFGVRP